MEPKKKFTVPRERERKREAEREVEREFRDVLSMHDLAEHWDDRTVSTHSAVRGARHAAARGRKGDG